MKILLVHIHYPISSGRYLARALSRLGHDVQSLGPSTGRDVWGIQVPEENVHQANFRFWWKLGEPFPIAEATEAGWELSNWRPDLVITSDSAFTITGRLPVPHVLFAMDNHVRAYRNLEAEGAIFDAMFLAHSWGARIGEPRVYWSPAGYDPEWCRDLGGERDMDFCFIGYPYANRLEMAASFRAAGLKGLFAIGLIGETYNQAYNRAKIAVCRSIKGDLTERFLENMASGCCVLSDRTEDADKLGFVAGVDYWPYQTTEDAVREAQYLIATGQWREIAANGKRKVAAHTWDNRAAKVLETVASLKEPVSQ